MEGRTSWTSMRHGLLFLKFYGRSGGICMIPKSSYFHAQDFSWIPAEYRRVALEIK
jgi:hypothetical protein